MENCGYSSPRSVAFPAGLRVLVVDDDPTWLKILEKMLIKCSYEVTTCGLATEALSLLRERKDRFDIIISDVNMPDMDGFKLLEHVGLEMDLPVIMMSVDGETSRVMKGVQHGACDYLLKPIRMKELRNIWQHVLRKRIHEIKDIENHDGHMEDRHLSSVTTDLTCVKKRKDLENKNDDRECNDYLSVKKTRIIWTVDLHQKFVKAVHLVGLDKVGPKKILDLMNIPWLTRENVASHLQKYRLYLSRLQKEKELKTSSFSRMKHRDFFSSKEHIVSQNLQNLTTMQQKESKNIDFKFLEGKGIGDNPKRETLDPQENSSSRMKFKNPFDPFDSKVKTIGSAENNNQHFLPSFNLVNLPTFQQKNIKTECLQPVFFPKSRPSSIGRQIIAEEENPPASFNSRTRNDLYSILPNTELLTTENTLKPNIIKSQRHDQIPVLDPRSNLSTMTDFATWCENQRVCSFDGDLHSLESLGSTGDSEHVRPETPACWMYDSLRVDSEYNPSDTMELSMVYNGLFMI